MKGFCPLSGKIKHYDNFCKKHCKSEIGCFVKEHIGKTIKLQQFI